MRQIDLQSMVDEARFSSFHWVVLIWCGLAIVFDGYDLAVVGIALPSIMKEMGVDGTQAGFMASSALFGMMFGTIVFGGFADRFGRRAVICLCIGVFSIFTAASGLAKDPLSFSLMRFLAGLGIGGVMPNVIAQTADYSPLKQRSTLVALMFSGYSVGAMLAAVLGKGLIEQHGWQTVFFAAAVPAVLLPWLWKQLPESMAFLLKQGRTEELQRIAQRLSPSYEPQPGDQFVLLQNQPKPEQAEAASKGGSPYLALFTEGRAFSTVMFWLTCFMSLFMVYSLNTWLTKLMAEAGFSLGSALNFVLALNIGATVGAIIGGWLADRFHIKAVLALMFLIAAVSISLMGSGLPTAALFLVVGVAGACTIGTQTVSCAYCSQFYPSSIRATGLGLMLGVGRIGAIVAPVIIGMIVSKQLPLQQNFMAIAIPSLVAAVSILLVNHSRSDLVRHRLHSAAA